MSSLVQPRSPGIGDNKPIKPHYILRTGVNKGTNNFGIAWAVHLCSGEPTGRALRRAGCGKLLRTAPLREIFSEKVAGIDVSAPQIFPRVSLLRVTKSGEGQAAERK